MSAEQESFIGKQLGVYQVQSKLGEGGMADVYKAYHPRLRREVAIKIIRSQIVDHEGFQVRFEREAQLIASLEHPHIVSVYDFGEEGNLTYLVMQYVGGGTLREQLHTGQPIEMRRAIGYALQMSRALHHAHQHGIVHRDVKPQNMLVSSSDRNHLLLSDFGIAKISGRSEDLTAFTEMPTRGMETDPSLTGVDQIVGTADYIAPEQASGQPVDARTDVYAMGVVLYQMLAGDMPFHATTLRGLLFQHVYTPPPSVRLKNPLIPEGLAQIISKALAKAPGERFQTAEALAQALEQVNANATNLANFSAGANPGNPIAYPQSMQTQQAWSSPGWPQTQADTRYTTYSDPLTMPGQSKAVSQVRAAQTTTNAPLTGSNPFAQTFPQMGRRTQTIAYIIIAGLIIVGLLVFGLRVFQNHGGANPGSSSSGLASSFNENFQNNNRDWPTGTLDQGIVATVPTYGDYKVTVPTNITAFPYPQKVGTLPDNFTLSATIQESGSSSSAFYGLAFHFLQTDSGITCYALVINNSGYYQILEYQANGNNPMVYQGNYSVGKQAMHTLSVKAQGGTYTFAIDGQSVQIAEASGNSASWSNSDLHNGLLALFLSGADTYQASNVQLSKA